MEIKNNNKAVAILITAISAIVVVLIVFVIIRNTSNTNAINSKNANKSSDNVNANLSALSTDKTLNFSENKVTFSIGYPATWTSCSEKTAAYYEGVVASIQSLANSCTVRIASTQDFHESDVDIDISFFNKTEPSLQSWVDKRLAGYQKNGYKYVQTKQNDESVRADYVDTKRIFDSRWDTHMILFYRSSATHIYEAKVYVRQDYYSAYQSIIEKILHSFSVIS